MSQKKVVVIAGPSGAGKNTLIREIRSRSPRAEMLTTATTRHPRPGEVDGADYYFWDIDRFDQETAAGNIGGTRFVPLFGGVHYGIYLPDLKRKLEFAPVIFASVDITGYEWLKERYPVTGIFLMPESVEEYSSRIRARSPEMTPRELEMRLRISHDEMHAHAERYDYRVTTSNGALMTAVERVLEILKKEGYTL